MEPVILTATQTSHVQWAIDAMFDHWCTEDGAHARDGEVLPETAMPRIEHNHVNKQRNRLWLSDSDDVNEDLLYRLEVQLQDMCDNPDQRGTASARGVSKASRNAAARIRHNIKHRAN